MSVGHVGDVFGLVAPGTLMVGWPTVPRHTTKKRSFS